MWTCMSHRPGMTKPPRPSIVRVVGGTGVRSAGPAAVIRSPATMIVCPAEIRPLSTSTIWTLVMASPLVGSASQALRVKAPAHAAPGVTGLSAHHCHLGDVDRAAAEAAFAIHQIIAPQLVELVAEPGELAARHRGVVALAPQAAGSGIIRAERIAILPRQAAFDRQRGEARLVEQQPAGKDVGLDEIGAGA